VGNTIKILKKRYALDRLRSKDAELFDIAYKYQFYGKRTKSIYLKLLYGLVCVITLYLAKKRKHRCLKRQKMTLKKC